MDLRGSAGSPGLQDAVDTKKKNSVHNNETKRWSGND